jgi:hypothetical protein
VRSTRWRVRQVLSFTAHLSFFEGFPQRQPQRYAVCRSKLRRADFWGRKIRERARSERRGVPRVDLFRTGFTAPDDHLIRFPTAQIDHRRGTQVNKDSPTQNGMSSGSASRSGSRGSDRTGGAAVPELRRGAEGEEPEAGDSPSCRVPSS